MIPIGDTPQTTRFPWVNYALIATNVAVFLYTLSLSTSFEPATAASQTVECYGHESPPSDLDSFYCRWAFQPGEFFDVATNDIDPAFEGLSRIEVIFSLVASMFMHGGWLHIAGNMLFLWVFGDNIEDRMGHLGYIGFYLVAGVAAAFTQAVVDIDSLVPIVGASGAVSGVLGAYIVLHPGAMVRALVPLGFILFPFQVPAFLMIGLWFLQNVLAGVAEFGAGTAAGSGVAYFAHLGGFGLGCLVALLLGAGQDGPPDTRVLLNSRPSRPP